ncbi:MAG: PAS domain-containing sensor histidine kinase [Gemmatimonadetes bacterium]|nr:PAS domain-containing sensor histidine kinase [Gemmatimonadota bacterium]
MELPSDALLAQIINAASDAIICVDQRQQITFFNDGAAHIFGYDAPEVIGEKLDRLIPARFHAAHRSHVRNFAHSPVPARRMAERSRVTGLRKDGSEFAAEASISKVMSDNGPLYAVILRDVSDERAAAHSNERLLVEMQRAVRARDDLLGLVSHDLRNPVNAVRMLAGAILRSAAEGEALPPHVAEHASVMQQAASQMDALIQDLLDVTRIEAGRLLMAPQPMASALLVAGALETMRPIAESRGLRLSSKVEPGTPPVMADPDRITQVFSNLIGNALRFSPDGEEVWIEAHVAAPLVTFSVHDRGAGITPEELPFVFDRFWQAKRTNRSGAGLGLSICRGIVHALGGQIWIVSDVGKGTVVSFTLPMAGEEPTA